MATIAILGAGMMGSAFAFPLVERGHRVRLVGTHLDGEIIRGLADTGVHPTLRVPIPGLSGCYPSERLSDALDSVDAVALGVSSAGVEWAGRVLAPLLPPKMPLLMVSKGLRCDAGRLSVLPDVLDAALPAALGIHPVAVAGPCIAGELARKVETCALFTGRDPEALERWAELARGAYYHVWTNTDVVGVEACAALKNAYAMGIGFAQGLHERGGGSAGSVAMHNYEASLYAEAILETERIVMALGGKGASAHGLAFAGDLNVTCNGGRTGRFGRLLGLGLSVSEAVARMSGATLECLEVLAVLRTALAPGAELSSLELPLLRHLIDVALDGRPIAMPFERFFSASVPD